MMKYTLTAIFLLTSILLSAKSDVVKPELSDSKSFSIVILPDLQSYAKFARNQPVMDLMTAWTASQIENLNIKAVFCTGDLVEHNEHIMPDGVTGDQTGTEQWVASSKAFEKLDNRVPYMISLGNHDYGYVRAENRLTKYNDYFPVERNSKWRESLVGFCNNVHGEQTLENAAFEMKTEHWGDILIINTEFAPRDEVLDWAKKLSESVKFENHKVIFLTHSYQDGEGERIVTEDYELAEPKNYGVDIWEKLIEPVANIRLLICGHYCTIGSDDDNVSMREDVNKAGSSVHQMMFNAQTADKEWFGNGGDGWLRILEFLPDGKTIVVKTYSPLFGFSPTTADRAWRREAYDEFNMIIK